MDELRFENRVVVVTGAGGGLGRSHALAFASRGAKVVVNDLGGSAHGEGAGSAMADAVVAEIREAGGEAVASYDSVEDGARIVETALDAFGRVDVVVNNAGILRDVSFHKMTDEDWDLVYRVHVKGSYAVTKAAWPHLREQRYGRVVMTASAAGIYGNFGQANYAMAKLGLTGFANTLAVEGRKRGVLVNTVAPIAGSRLTETVLPDELVAALDPASVSPLVLWLCHESCEETGGLFEVGGGYFGKLRWERAPGRLYRTGRTITPEDVRASWAQITDFTEGEHPASIAESMAPIMDNVQRGPSKGGNEHIDVDEALGWEFPEVTSTYDERDLALYALGVGAARDDATGDGALSLVYEGHGKFAALPTYGVIPAINVILEMAKKGVTAPGLRYGLDRVLHGEQYTELKRPLPPRATLTHRARIADIFDKGKGALVVTAIESFDEDGELLVVNRTTTFVRGAGGWGGDRGPSGEANAPPERAPDAVVEERIPESQALLYRLSGDWNPLHVDPSFAQAFGFDRPILHGLCTFGYAGRHVIAEMAPDGDPRLFRSIQARFAKNVFPGDTLVTEMWKEGDRRVVFRCKVKERDEVVLSHASVALFDEIPKKKPREAATAEAAPTAGPTSADVFGAIRLFLAAEPGSGDRIGHVFQFRLSDPESVWTIDVSRGDGAVSEGETAKPDCTLEMSDADFMDMCTGEADAQKLYFGGQLKIGGDVMASQKLSFLKKVTPEMVERAMAERGDAGARTAPEGPASADVFAAIAHHVKTHPELVGRVGHVFRFELRDPDSVWTLDLKSGEGSVVEGEVGEADCTLTISEADFVDMASGKADAQKLYFGGQLKIGGNVMASQKLTFLKDVDREAAADAIAGARAARAARGGAAAAPSRPKREPVAPRLFARLAEAEAILAELGPAPLRFRVTDPDAVWTVDPEGGTVTEGEAGEAAATFTLTDEDLATLAEGGDARVLFQRGQLRVDGDVTAARRLAALGRLAGSAA
ncbi:MAG TPA: SDR family NAD(P)-dependent oxidoreductase [Sandaracinaceae bacterium LLY-WYZ-13_1]|nr:SDR family NAD(P)-dependent oxidoreductase [Sandaracinaceae bacterium LLY-WYZ-13_1]